MNSENFASLAAAYGGDLDRWPDAERATAQVWLDGHPEAAKALHLESDLDAVLNDYRVQAPSSDLQRRISSVLLQVGSRPRRLVDRFASWLALGSAGALSAGVLAGCFLFGALPHGERGRPAAGSLYEQSSFGDFDGVGEDGASR